MTVTSKFRVALLVLALAVGPVRAEEAGPTWVTYAPDPGGYAKGWTTAHWIASLERMLVWGGHSHNPRGNNSLRLFDPVRNTWTTVFPNSNGSEGLQNRDNHFSFHVPQRGAKGEFWVVGGATGQYGGRFDLASSRWVKIATSPQDFAEGLIADFALQNNYPGAHAWCPEIDTGVVFAGASTNLLQIIEPSGAGDEPYRFWKGVRSGSPSPRRQLQNNAVCVGDTFYVYGGQTPDGVNHADFWALDVRGRAWTRLPDAPVAAYQPVLTYDPGHQAIVLHGGGGNTAVVAYDLAGKRWREAASGGDRLPRRRNHAGVYSPAVQRHLYTGGVHFGDSGYLPWTHSLKTDGYRLSLPDGPRPGAAAAPAGAGPAPAPLPAVAAPRDPHVKGVDRPGPPPAAPRPAEAASAAATVPDAPPAIADNTWIARRLPGKGRAPWGPMKHVRLVYNPDDGRIYFFGGDYAGPTGMQSGRNEVYSYSVAHDDWRLEFPYCAPPGAVQPSHPDEVGVAYDTRRQIFWLVNGYMGGIGSADLGKCDPSRMIRGRMMTFDWRRRQWNFPDRTEFSGGLRGEMKFAQYDAQSDSLIQFVYDGSPAVATYHIESDRWRKKRFRGNARLAQEHSAMDADARVIYVLEPLQGQLYRYDIASESLKAIGSAPRQGRLSYTRPVWDPANNVLLWFQFVSTEPRGRLHVYDPSKNSWELDVDAAVPEGLQVRGNNAVFDPANNVLLVMGGYGPDNPYVFLYRYRNDPRGGRERAPGR